MSDLSSLPVRIDPDDWLDDDLPSIVAQDGETIPDRAVSDGFVDGHSTGRLVDVIEPWLPGDIPGDPDELG